jgi:cysteinyl-tRNA synthetase
MSLRLHNTLTRRLEEFRPADPERVTFYSCGPTVYDDAHIGNFRSFLAADLLRRFVESPLCVLAGAEGRPHAGPRTVVHVMNITDVGHMTDDAEGGEAGEDRMAVAGRRLAEAKKSGKLPADAKIDPGDPYAIAGFYAERFLEDARTLGLKVALEAQADPTLMPRPTQKIGGMVAMILSLLAKGNAYAVGEPGRQVVYFDVESFRDAEGKLRYGELSGNTLDKLRTGAGGRISEGNQQQKRNPADFLLWKADPSHIMKWDPATFDPRATWGAGYPGWHIECSVMAAERLVGDHPALESRATGKQPVRGGGATGALIDLHSGGEDNIFPHHECEIAQSCCAAGVPNFARMWFHPRHLFVEGAKMSKSKGNFFTIRDLIAKGFEPAAIRLELIKTHYRSNANFTVQGLEDSARMVERWRRARIELARRSFAWGGSAPTAFWLAKDLMEQAVARAMNDDLNIAMAVAEVNTWTGTVLERTAEWEGRAAATDAQIEASLQRRSGLHDYLDVVDSVFGVLALERPKAAQTDIGIFLPGTTPDPAVIALLVQRREAKAAKDFKASDAIRDQLAGMGLAIKDVAGGKVEVSRKN